MNYVHYKTVPKCRNPRNSPRFHEIHYTARTESRLLDMPNHTGKHHEIGLMTKQTIVMKLLRGVTNRVRFRFYRKWLTFISSISFRVEHSLRTTYFHCRKDKL